MITGIGALKGISIRGIGNLKGITIKAEDIHLEEIEYQLLKIW